MSRRVLIFFPHNPWPPRSGAHHRFLELAGGLRELGYRPSLVSSRLMSEVPWTDESVRGLTTAGFEQVRVHRPGVRDYAVSGALMLPHRLRGTAPRFDSWAFTPPGLVRTFRRAVAELDPDAVVMNFAFWDPLIDHAGDRGRLRVIDTIDTLSLQAAMRAAVNRHLPARRPVDPAELPEAVLREDFYDPVRQTLDPREFAVYDRYSVTLAISQTEAALFRRECPHTRTVYLPMTFRVPEVANAYSGRPVFVAGNNPYNVQGYCYLARRVMPTVLAARLDASVRVIGPVTERVGPAAGLERVGFVADLKGEYERAGFAVCPVFGGTGQQVKIVEAMAHGLPVVALRAAADQSPLKHGESGLVAQTADEFAAHVLALSSNPELCQRLGQTAREVIATTLSRDRLLRDLDGVFNTPRGTPPASPPRSAPR